MTWQARQEPIDILSAAFEPEDECSSSQPASYSSNVQAIALFNFDWPNFVLSVGVMRSLSEEVTERIYAENLGSSMMETTKIELWDALKVSFDFAENRSNDDSFRLIVRVYMKLANNKSLNGLFESIFENWTQSARSMGIFAKGMLARPPCLSIL